MLVMAANMSREGKASACVCPAATTNRGCPECSISMQVVPLPPVTINYQLSTINYQLSTINYQLSTINYQL
jgi:hypothetical protein